MKGSLCILKTIFKIGSEIIGEGMAPLHPVSPTPAHAGEGILYFCYPRIIYLLKINQTSLHSVPN